MAATAPAAAATARAIRSTGRPPARAPRPRGPDSRRGRGRAGGHGRASPTGHSLNAPPHQGFDAPRPRRDTAALVLGGSGVRRCAAVALLALSLFAPAT